MHVPEGWVDAARLGFVDAWRLMAGRLPDGAWDEHDGLALTATGVTLSGCNTVMALRAPDNPAAALDHAGSFFAGRGLPWTLFATGSAAEALTIPATRAGLKPSRAEPAMFLSPERVRPPADIPGLEIEVVRSAATMNTYLETAARGFGEGPEGFAIWATPDLIDTAGLFFYLGRLNGEPVVTSSLYTLHGIGTINMVSTLEPYRRRGLGEAMVHHAVSAAFSLNCAAAFLHSSEMGLSLYEKMGFRQAYSYSIWVYR